MAAMCVQDVDVQSSMQFTLIHTVGCALHRHTSRVIHRSELYSYRQLVTQKNDALASRTQGRHPQATAHAVQCKTPSACRAMKQVRLADLNHFNSVKWVRNDNQGGGRAVAPISMLPTL